MLILTSLDIALLSQVKVLSLNRSAWAMMTEISVESKNFPKLVGNHRFSVSLLQVSSSFIKSVKTKIKKKKKNTIQRLFLCEFLFERKKKVKSV